MHMMPTSSTVTLTSRARIRQLESDVSSLWTVVRKLEAKLGCVPSEVSPCHQETEGGGPHEQGDDDSESDASGLSSTIPPSHLHQLFENPLIGSTAFESPMQSPHTSIIHNSKASSALRRLMPSRQEMLKIAGEATSWLSLYKSLFPINFLIRDGDELSSQYDKLQEENPNPVRMAAFLLYVAITVQQAPDETSGYPGGNIKEASVFIKDVSDSIEKVIISDNELVGSLEGIETALLFIRL
jgi:hypothetical protein